MFVIMWIDVGAFSECVAYITVYNEWSTLCEDEDGCYLFIFYVFFAEL